MHDLSVGRQYQPELQNDGRNLRRLGPEHRPNGRCRSLRATEPHQHRVHDAGGDIDDSPQKSGHSSVPAGPPTSPSGYYRAGEQLPDGDTTGRIRRRESRRRGAGHRNSSKLLKYRVLCRIASMNAASRNARALRPQDIAILPTRRIRSSPRRRPTTAPPSFASAFR